jgi:simple sugar transport system ATP-binding protein
LRYEPDTPTSCAVRQISFEVAPGEIFGVVGVDGNGQDELTNLITGARAPLDGSIRLGGSEMAGRPVAAYLKAGVGIVPADRQRQGLAMAMPLARNLILDRRREARFVKARGLLLDDQAIMAYGAEMIEKFDIRAEGPGGPVSSLSGGNQQKVVVARELERDIRLLVASQPTRGLDVGSIEQVHRRLLEVAERGCAVVLVTSELDEALALSDRIAPLCEGRITAIEEPPFDRHRIGLLMGGG